MESVSDLRARLRIQEIAKRLAAHEPRPKVARELNLRPDQLQKIIFSDEFLEFVDTRNSSAYTGLAVEIREEMARDDESDAQVLIINAEAEATKELLAQMRSADKPSDRRAAAIAVIELARKIDASKKDTTTKKYSFPASQLKTLAEAAREMDEQREHIHSDDVSGATVSPVVSATG
jgi:hypothetical protein